MTLKHVNRIRHNAGKQVVRELQDVERLEPANKTLTESSILAHAYEIHISRNGAPRNA